MKAPDNISDGADQITVRAFKQVGASELPLWLSEDNNPDHSDDEVFIDGGNTEINLYIGEPGTGCDNPEYDNPTDCQNNVASWSGFTSLEDGGTLAGQEYTIILKFLS